MRLRPRMGNSRGEGGRMALGIASMEATYDINRAIVPKVIVEGLELGKVTVKGRYVLRSYTPERSDLQNIPYSMLAGCKHALNRELTRHSQILLVLVQRRKYEPVLNERDLNTT